MSAKRLSELSDGQLKRLFLRLSIKEMTGTSNVDDPTICDENKYLYLFSKDGDCSPDSDI